MKIATQTWNEADSTGEYEMSEHSCAAVYHAAKGGKITVYKSTELRVAKWGAQVRGTREYLLKRLTPSLILNRSFKKVCTSSEGRGRRERRLVICVC